MSQTPKLRAPIKTSRIIGWINRGLSIINVILGPVFIAFPFIRLIGNSVESAVDATGPLEKLIYKGWNTAAFFGVLTICASTILNFLQTLGAFVPLLGAYMPVWNILDGSISLLAIFGFKTRSFLEGNLTPRQKVGKMIRLILDGGFALILLTIGISALVVPGVAAIALWLSPLLVGLRLTYKTVYKLCMEKVRDSETIGLLQAENATLKAQLKTTIPPQYTPGEATDARQETALTGTDARGLRSSGRSAPQPA